MCVNNVFSASLFCVSVHCVNPSKPGSSSSRVYGHTFTHLSDFVSQKARHRVQIKKETETYLNKIEFQFINPFKCVMLSEHNRSARMKMEEALLGTR